MTPIMRAGLAIMDGVQKIDSAKTSRKQVPALHAELARRGLVGPRNIDIGGGAWDTATEFLASLGVENRVFDPYNRTREECIATLSAGPFDTATISNVLNVIGEKPRRFEVIELASLASRKAYFSVYKAPRRGPTRDGWQEGRALESYLPEILQSFRHAVVVGGFIEASGARRSP